MEIGIVISGTLTGFSLLYADVAGQAYLSEGKFDFDNRNYLANLDYKEKAYAVSFSPKILAISIITRVLDSFHRPGILVISALFPRKCRIVSGVDGENQAAAYQLLNAVNERFYEKNFLNGMLNQNSSVLRQDYYADILSMYKLVADESQRGVNLSLNMIQLNKNIGYVASVEEDMPNYLTSCCRRSYEGFHHVLFGKNVPQNIAEPPVEVVLYKVHIVNNDLWLPTTVKKTDPIYRLSPGVGEKDLNQDYTYEEVLSGKAGTQIRANIVGEMIEMRYHFQTEERTIHFVFVDGSEMVPFYLVRPVIVGRDSKLKISSEDWTFLGKEIYETYRMACENPLYRVKPGSADLRVQNLKDGGHCYIEVEACSEWTVHFANDVPKKIILTRRGTSEALSLTAKKTVTVSIPGKQEEWAYRIETDEYETIEGQLPLVGEELVFTPKKKGTQLPPAGDVQTDDKRAFASSPRKPQTRGTVQVEVAQNHRKPLKVKKVIKISLVAAVGVMIIGLVSWGMIQLINGGEDEVPLEETVAEEPAPQQAEKILKGVEFSLRDSKGNKIDGKKIENWSKILDLECSIGTNIKSEKKTSFDKGSLAYSFEALSDCKDTIRLSIALDNIGIGQWEESFKLLEEEEVIRLDYSMSEIDLYMELYNVVELHNVVSPQEKREWKEKIDKIQKNTDFFKALQAMYEKLPTNSVGSNMAEGAVAAGNVGKKTADKTNIDSKADGALDDRVYYTLEELDRIHFNDEIIQQSLKHVLMDMEKGQLPEKIGSLSLSKNEVKTKLGHFSQYEIVEALITTYKVVSDKQKFSDELKGKKSLFQALDLIKNNNKDLYEVIMKKNQ